MTIFHKHNWIKIKETYAPPFDIGLIKMRGYNEESFSLIKISNCGLTTIIWECTECSKRKREELLGK